MVEAYELSDLPKADSSTPRDEGKRSESSMVDDILKYFQQQSNQSKPQVFTKSLKYIIIM